MVAFILGKILRLIEFLIKYGVLIMQFASQIDVVRAIQEIIYKKASDEINFLLDNYGSPQC